MNPNVCIMNRNLLTIAFLLSCISRNAVMAKSSYSTDYSGLNKSSLVASEESGTFLADKKKSEEEESDEKKKGSEETVCAKCYPLDVVKTDCEADACNSCDENKKSSKTCSASPTTVKNAPCSCYDENRQFSPENKYDASKTLASKIAN